MYAQATLRQLTALEALAARGARTALAERANDDDRAAAILGRGERGLRSDLSNANRHQKFDVKF